MESLEKQEVKSSEKANELLSFDKVVSTSANSNDDDIFRADEGHKSKKTAVNYRNNFRLFLKFIKIYDLQVLLDLGKEAIQELVTRYAKAMRDDPIKKYSYNTVHNRMSAIFYFFENNDIELNKRKIRRYYPPDESMNNDKLYTEEQTRKILSVCDLRTKAMIHLMLSSGCRIGSLHTMLVKDLISVSYQGQYLYKVRVHARTRDEYFSFVTPEAKTEGIDPYLDYRRRCGEKLTDEAPLFRKQFNRSVLINTPYPLSQDAVMKSFDECLKKAGVKSSKIRRSHSLRKAFKSICEQSGMKSINVELLMGHDIGVSGHYYRPAESDILEDFMSHAADALTISDEYRLKKRNQELETVQAQEIASLKAKLEDKEQQLRHTVEALEIKSKNSIDKIEKQILKLNDRIVEITTDNENGGMHCYKFKSPD